MSKEKRAAASAERARAESTAAALVGNGWLETEPELDERQSGRVQSIERAFAILEAVARHRDGIGLAELSKAVGLHKSTTFHLVKTMVSLGYIRQMDKTYRVGRPLFALAASALDEIELVSLATPVLEELSREAGETSHFAVRMGDSVVIIARTSGPSAFQLSDRAGIVRPAHATALGKVILAALRPEQLERFLQRTALAAFTPKTVVDPERLREEIEDVRRSGVAYDDGEFDAEVRCIAVPVHDFTGQVVGSIGISGPVWRLSIQLLPKRTEILQRAAERLSAQFGASV
jgi:DNA-binding IclR family transcriptional regulator